MGDYIQTRLEDVLAEIEALRRGGVSYYHWHARNPLTREQSCDEMLYQLFGQRQRQRDPGLAISYGGSRNGPEIHSAIAKDGEWARIRHAALARHEGGADFVTTQAAIELAIPIDLEKQGYLRHRPAEGGYEITRSLESYLANHAADAIPIETHSTNGGGNYGTSSAAEQLRLLARAINERNRLGLPQEVEWTQLDRSYILTKLLLDDLYPGIGHTGRLNLTILFGFSPKLPFPKTYAEFQRAICLARSLERIGRFPALHLTISVGAAILPQRVLQYVAPLDIGPYRGSRVSPLERLAAYACQPDSGVDLLRFGLEDHPFLLDENHTLQPVSNVELMNYTSEMIDKHGGQIVTDPIAIRHFVSTESRPYVED